MGQSESKDELLYKQVSYGNIDGIKSLASNGAGLEWFDKDGKTPLIVASMNPELHSVAKTLIELGAKVNAYRPGCHAGTPLHHAAKRGLQNTVKLLLSHGANPLIMNDVSRTPLDMAREKGHTNVVRTIENHICLFSGWMREFYGLGFLEAWAPQLVSKKVWVVVLPSGFHNPTKPFKLELAIYPSEQDAQPRTVIALWKANLEEPKSNQPDLSVSILVNTTITRGRRRRRRCRPRVPSQTRIKLAPEKEGDRHQYQLFCNACKGIPQVLPAFLHDNQIPALPATAPPAVEDIELAMAISASIQSALEENPPLNPNPSSEASSSNAQRISANTITYDVGSSKAPVMSNIEGPNYGPSSSGTSSDHNHVQNDSDVPATPPMDLIASAPPVLDEGPIQYPSIDLDPIEISPEAVETVVTAKSDGGGDKKDERGSSSCVICLDAPVEGACIPCGHMAGCMSCLNEIKAKKWGCPVCRAKIDQVVRLYAV